MMEKAYDVKDLMKKLEAQGLNLAEDAASSVIKETMAWLRESASVSTNKVDDMLAPLLVPLEAYVKEQIDKIDGEQG